jgi:sRNA-binding carbon storage regulator CsrA
MENGKARSGFETAEDVSVHRLEVWERIRANARISPAKKTDSPDWASNPIAHHPTLARTGGRR